jgi:hypothetical protein
MIADQSAELPTYEELTVAHDNDGKTISSLNTAITTLTVLLVISTLAFFFSCFTYCRSTNFRSPYQIVRVMDNNTVDPSTTTTNNSGRFII